ncbi:hypothetical protein [Vallitalea guaymasensis]|nr:hypothetical protein [Vallitalea guaymasensis]
MRELKHKLENIIVFADFTNFSEAEQLIKDGKTIKELGCVEI